MNAPRDANLDDYLVKTMKDPAEAAAYIEAVMELDDPAALLVALRHVAKAHGMAEIARRADVGDKTLFKALSATGNPTLATVHKVLAAVGLRLSVTPAHV
ncbi:addiction module antidote protein [Rhodoferax sp.]|uniref:addiction module antidote protein n=1 Tax=Rhodoferax sp. TaxID=50421 RepID=UPI002734A0B3|nr:addiction module antidote protein [Rhodoferax sp.]MDP3191031.1 putative addiction module antidote protein [Rhodoferax sp.]MDP3335252.1 putative addiction module antidote protein [Rhodoferax sp.]MDP3864359.1 putative addiction module antidote protein [Rhodoferax sp.]